MGQFPEVTAAPFDLELHRVSTLSLTATVQRRTSPHWDKPAVRWPIAALTSCEVCFSLPVLTACAALSSSLATSKQTRAPSGHGCLSPLPSVRISASALHRAKLKSRLLTGCQFPPYFSSHFSLLFWRFVLSGCRLDCPAVWLPCSPLLLQFYYDTDAHIGEKIHC